MASPPLDNVLHVIAGGPRLISNGSIHITADEEKFKNDVKNSRTSRTAVGITKEYNLMFLVIEGNNHSESKRVGATLKDLAEIMTDMGVIDAMNLDGGGSSTMI